MLKYLFTEKYVDTILINMPIAISDTPNMMNRIRLVDENIRNSSFSMRYTNPTKSNNATKEAIMP